MSVLQVQNSFIRKRKIVKSSDLIINYLLYLVNKLLKNTIVLACIYKQ